MKNSNLVQYLQTVHTKLLGNDRENRKSSLLERIEANNKQIGILFAGQGFDYVRELKVMYKESPLARAWMDTANDSLVKWLDSPEILSKGLFPLGLHLTNWIQSNRSLPQSYLERVSVSHPMIFIAQIAQYLQAMERGLHRINTVDQISFIAGYSQGMIPALCIAEMIGEEFSTKRALEYLKYTFWQGILMEEQWLRLNQPEHAEFTPMASISSIDFVTLNQCVQKVQKTLEDGTQITIAIRASRTRFVVSGPGQALEQLHGLLQGLKNKQAQAKKQGFFGGKVSNFVWENIPVAAAFHNEMLRGGIDNLREKCVEIGFSIDVTRLRVPVLCYDQNKFVQELDDALVYLMTCQFVLPVQWFHLLNYVLENNLATILLDFGPGDGLGRLSSSTIRGSELEIVSLSTTEGQERLFSKGAKGADRLVYSDFIPTLVDTENGPIIDNVFTQSTGCPPIILPGMTPTTADVDIVVAAANAGYVAELAGGGQVNEKIFWTRMEELKNKLQPGRGVVFNALFLDRYLWDLHFGKHNLVIKARQAGYPISGVTISAGIPDVDEAVELFRNFQKNGIWLNALKAGNDAQVKQICQIAKALPEQTLFIHVEGGKAGGHHSWEDLEQLLLDGYHLIRACTNLVLCVGGGIATEEQAATLLHGTWSRKYSLQPMPVDAVFLGTICMATLEAKTSLQVKESLVHTQGTSKWVFAGENEGGMTSGKSQLNADIHYVDNFAAQCGRLLDSVAGKADEVHAKYEEIIVALNKTAKPFFGEVEDMTYEALLLRMIELMKVGRYDLYEDGCWPDRSYRERFADMIWRSEARLHPKQEGKIESFLCNLEALDHPEQVLSQFTTLFPESQTQLLHPSDKNFFLNKVCKRPGKPVNFVPVIDADVRRWYKSDSLWYSHDERFNADQVLIIPGPEAITGIKRVNEPIAELFSRFANVMKRDLAPKPDQAFINQGSYRDKYRNIQLDTMDESIVVTLLADDVDWFNIIPSSLQRGVIAFWGQSQILCADRMEENILRRVCRPRKGAKLTISSNNFICHPYPDHDSKICITESDDGAVVLEMFDADVSDLHKPLLTQIYRPFYREGGNVFRIDEEHKSLSIMELYHSMLFGDAIAITPLFSTASDTVQFTESELQGYLTSLGERGLMPTLNFMFSLGWKPLFSVLSCIEIRAGLLDLVHLSNDVQTKEAWPPAVGEILQANARVFRLETKNGGQAVSVRLTIVSPRGLCAEVNSEFFIRKAPHHALPKILLSTQLQESFEITTQLQADLINQLPFVSLTKLVQAQCTVVFKGKKDARYGWNQQNHFTGAGDIWMNDELIGGYSIDQLTKKNQHPLDRLISLFEDAVGTKTPVRKLIREEQCWAPTNMAGYAKVSRDQNPIHQSRMFANLAGMNSPIVHGMWTAGQMHSVLRRSLVDDAQLRIKTFKVMFDAPLPLGSDVLIRVWKTGYHLGAHIVDIQAVYIHEGTELVVARAQAQVRPLVTAYVFPGQGIQEQNMGMDLYKKSSAARAIWNKADEHTRLHLGFSILRVVQQNPTVIHVGREVYRHPKGVLNLTQFTQVAMATMAQAQVAWLKEEGLFNPYAITCGHSVGEYNAISAVLQAIPLEEIVSVVWHRGLTMHTIVERDERGRSKYKMGVIRPHYANLSHQQAEDLVASIRDTSGYFIEIVNYNVRGRQYSVTGEEQGLEILADTLQQTATSNKQPYVEVPGIDVPFHSRLLIKGVSDFRDTLHAVFPEYIDPALLINRYIPNLTASVFRMEKSFVEEILAVVDSAPMREILHNWEASIANPVAFCRTTLIELLAWQFASPVRWIETQEIMFASVKNGGLAVQEMVEIGSAKQPTLTNMGSYSLSMLSTNPQVFVYNIEAEKERLFGVDVIPSKVQAIEKDIPQEVVVEEPKVVVQASPSAKNQSIPDSDVTHAIGLKALIAKQANLRLEQIEDFETIDEIFEGVSSKRNQLLLDLGAEFSIGAIDAAHEKPLSELVSILKERSPAWSIGPYLNAAIDDASKHIFGRSTMSRADVTHKLQQEYGVPNGVVKQSWILLALESRDGKSIRGGDVGKLNKIPTDKKSAESFIQDWMNVVGQMLGVSIQPSTTNQGGGHVDSALLHELQEQILGKDGILMKNMRSMAEELGHSLHDSTYIEPDTSISHVMQGEFSQEYFHRLSPIFSAEKHAPFLSVWASAHAEAASMLHRVLHNEMSLTELKSRCSRLAAFTSDSRVKNTLQHTLTVLKDTNRTDLVEVFETILRSDASGAIPLWNARPSVSMNENGVYAYSEVVEKNSESFLHWVFENVLAKNDVKWSNSLQRLVKASGKFEGLTVLITGASPDSIAVEIVRQLLRGNAKVIVTTTSYSAKRMAFYRDLYNQDAGPEAQLHILPYNQASMQDADSLVEWLFQSDYELLPNVVLPFGAMKAYGALSDMDAMTEVSMRAMLTGVERLIANIGNRLIQAGGGECHVILPLSPNHGIFGGDGLYAESKAALEVLLHKCVSEQEQWARNITMCGAIIGWVRGTGLMNDNNIVASGLEQSMGIRTFSTSEMGVLIASLCDPSLIDQTRKVWKVDLSGGLLGATNLKEAVSHIRTELDEESMHKRGLHEMLKEFKETDQHVSKWSKALPSNFHNVKTMIPFHHGKPLAEQVVIVGYGEVGPCGSARTRFDMEMSEDLAPGAVVELAWITGLIRYENDSWVDVESGAVIEDGDIAETYRSKIKNRTGIRFIEPKTVGFNTRNVETWVIAYLDKPFHFTVGSKEEAETYCKFDASKSSVSYIDGEWRVSLAPGAQIRLPKSVEFTRHVGGVVPDGFDFSRYGIPNDMLESVDRLTLFNLVATVDAWISAGLTPEELLSFMHPARIGNTQSSGIGGMRSLTKLYTDPVLGKERQNDILQETLLNVMAAYVVQSFVGSYGPMSHPVGACATAALSIESGMEKILLGKADFVVTGGFDDIGLEGMFGFADMNATAPTQEMLAKGFEPQEFSRSNDIRRGGFVEAQGGGTVLLARGDIAAQLGLPVYGVLAMAASYSDGIHRSIPAPGKGLLAMAMGGKDSLLGSALTSFGMTIDDIGVVYKHDTSTTANDVNENEIHHKVQEHLGRTNGNPLWVVSQKTITGHSKGGAAAWQVIGLCQALNAQRIPGNKNLACVDPVMKDYHHMCFTNDDIRFATQSPLKAGLVTSLGFGHVSGVLMVLHPDVFSCSLSDEMLQTYTTQSDKRKRFAKAYWEEIQMGKVQAFNRVQGRRFRSKDGTKKQNEEECRMLLTPSARLVKGVYDA